MQAAESSAIDGQVLPEADKLRQRRTSNVPTQSGRTSPNNGRRRDGTDTLPLTLTLIPAANNGRRFLYLPVGRGAPNFQPALNLNRRTIPIAIGTKYAR